MIPAKLLPVNFAPDLDPCWNVNAGVLVDVSDAIPTRRSTLKSYLASSAQAVSSLGTFSETTYGKPLHGQMIKSLLPAGSPSGITVAVEPLIGTTKRLLSISSSGGGTFYDASKGATDYTTATGWTFTTFGNLVIACSKENAPQVATLADGGMVFADLGGTPPKAKVCTTQKNFVMLGDTNDGVNNLLDQVWWSGLGNQATWTPSASTQAGNLRLLETPGPITAMVNIRDAVAVYKEDSIYVMDYQGSPLLWTSRLISNGVGCSSPHGVCVVNGIHYFTHRSGVYRFDGASVQPIGPQVAHYLSSKVNLQKLYGFVQAAHEESENCVYWFFGNNTDGSGVRDKALVWNYATGEFGFVTNTWAVSGSEGMRCVIPATLTDFGWSWDATLAAASTNLLLLGTSNTAGGTASLRLPSFGTSALTLTTGDMGDDTQFTKITRIKPRLLTTASALSATLYCKNSEGSAFDAGTTYTSDASFTRLDGAKSARWHKAVISVTAGEVGGLSISSVQSGSE